MKVILFLFMGIFFAVCSMAQDGAENALVKQRKERVINGLLPATPFENKFAAPKTLKDRMAYYQTPGVSIAVIKDHRIEWAQGFGVVENGKSAPVTTQTLFQAASISKAVFAVAVMKLVQAGTLDLDEDVNAYLKTWRVPKNGDWQPRITLRQILSHSAGLSQSSFPGYLRSQKLPSVIDILNGHKPANTNPVVVNILPGVEMRYAGGGTMVAQQVVTDKLNKPFFALMNELVLTPLNLTNTTYQYPLPKQLEKMTATGHYLNRAPLKGKYYVYPETAAAGMWSTPIDLAKFGLALQAGVQGQSDFLAKKSLMEMITPSINETMGLGFFLAGTGNAVRFLHAGSNEGFKADAVFYKEGGLGAVVMLNSNAGDLLFEIERAIAKEYNWPGYFAEDKKPVSLPKHVLKALAGNYKTNDGKTYELALTDDKIYLKYDRQPALELIATSPTRFSFVALNGSITIEKGEMVLVQNGRDIKAVKQ